VTQHVDQTMLHRVLHHSCVHCVVHYVVGIVHCIVIITLRYPDGLASLVECFERHVRGFWVNSLSCLPLLCLTRCLCWDIRHK
jgi:hypothetical protein